MRRKSTWSTQQKLRLQSLGGAWRMQQNKNDTAKQAQDSWKCTKKKQGTLKQSPTPQNCLGARKCCFVLFCFVCCVGIFFCVFVFSALFCARVFLFSCFVLLSQTKTTTKRKKARLNPRCETTLLSSASAHTPTRTRTLPFFSSGRLLLSVRALDLTVLCC